MPPRKFALTVDAVVFDGDKVLTIKRKNEPFQGMSALPGGFLDPGETLEQAVKRELHEETGIRALAAEFLGIYDTIDRDPRQRVISAAYLITSWSGMPIAADDAAEVGWSHFYEELAFDHNLIVTEAIPFRKSSKRINLLVTS
jgi:8-oxo-dGTP diphosphatase